MKVVIVSGFLGAGKTTFIKELIKKSGTFPVVLENEYGDNDLDKRDLQNSASGELKILEFMEGCVCCTKKDTFLNSVLAISAALDPEYLVVEPTGVGKLGSILENVQTVTYERIRLLPPVVVLAPQSFHEFKREYPDIYVNQIENAGIIVFSKCENADPGVLAQISEEIHEIRPDVEIVSEHYSGKDEAWFRGILDASDVAAPAVGGSGDADCATDPLDEVSLREMTFQSPGALVSFLNSILLGRFGNVVRGKGVVRCGRELLRFDFADNMYAIKAEDEPALEDEGDGGSCEDDERRKEVPVQAVFIGRDLRAEEIKKAGNVLTRPFDDNDSRDLLSLDPISLPGKVPAEGEAVAG